MAAKYAVENHEVPEDANVDHKDGGDLYKATSRTSPKESDEIFILKTKAEVVD